MRKSTLFIIAVSSFPVLAFANDDRVRTIETQGNGNQGRSSYSAMPRFDKPIILEFYNSGGYTANFRVIWTDSATGQDMNKTVLNNPSGTTIRIEVPISAVESSIKAQGYAQTGWIWGPTKTIFSVPVVNVYTERSRYAMGYKVWGTTYYPGWANYKPELEIDGMDPYSDDPYDCTELTIYGDQYGSLLSPNRDQYDLRNVCKYPVIFTLKGASGSKDVNVAAESTGYVYTGKYNTYAVRRGN